ncbi:MAG: choice-of-anchor L domain-containing protein [Bacteroidota bacterium]
MLPTLSSFAQVTVNGNQTAVALAQQLVGAGVTVSNPTLTCPTNANGIFHVVTSNLGLDSGIVLTSGTAATSGTAIGVNGTEGGSNFVSTNNNAPGDVQLNALAGQTTFDACALEFDFIPQGDTIKFKYVFGSQEYTNYSCSNFNDVFGFFITGPGIVGSPNIALIPGTNIPVAINSTTDPVVNNVSNTSQCTAMGPGSPFSQYYVNNLGGATITYPGFTTVLTAIHSVTPCQSYHLKMAVADASDGVLDSGVFIEGGSLTSPGAASASSFGSGGLPYCVRGCLPGKYVFKRPLPLPIPLVIHYGIIGTAINGYDYQTIPDSVVIPAYDTMTTEYIFGLYVPPAGPKTVGLILTNNVNCVATLDTVYLTIYDSIYTKILSPDTTICLGNTVNIQAEGDTILSFAWTPVAGLTSTNTLNTSATPLGTTTYTITSDLLGAGCPPVHHSITITVDTIPSITITPDTTICLGMSVPLSISTFPSPLPTKPYTYQWTPAGSGLSGYTIPDPIATPTATTTYVVTVSPVASGCSAKDTMKITVLPNDFTLYNGDTAICRGGSIVINATGDPNFTYVWSPTNGIVNPFIINPTITPDTSNKYTVTASYPGCPLMTHSFTVDVQPIPIAYAGVDRQVCEWDTLHMHASVTPGWYTHYSYQWSPTTHLDYPTQPDVVFNGTQDTDLIVTITTPVGCSDTDTVHITVWPGAFATVTPTQDINICPGDSVQFGVTGSGVAFQWSPELYLNDSTIPNPMSHPITNISYHLLVTDIHGCKDTFDRNIYIHPQAVLSLPDSVVLYPGESSMLIPAGNCIASFNWSPSIGLSSTNISNPTAMPDISTRYYLTASTEWNCVASDSIDVIVHGESIVGIPNAFSPGTGPNSDLKIIMRGIATLKNFSIFNRWGNKVFETADINEGWNGKYKGEPQPMGVYVYMVEAYTKAGQRIYKQGNITLIR